MHNTAICIQACGVRFQNVRLTFQKRTFAASKRTFAVSKRTFAVSKRTFAVSKKTVLTGLMLSLNNEIHTLSRFERNVWFYIVNIVYKSQTFLFNHENVPISSPKHDICHVEKNTF